MPSLAGVEPATWPAPAVHAAVLVWSRRVRNEAQSVALAHELRAVVGSDDPVLAAALDRLADDEQSHVELATAFLAVLGAAPPPPEPALPDHPEPPTLRALRCVLTGLAVCETVSAMRFATVRAHTDLAAARACIELFLRDEIAHARLGFLLLPGAIAARAAEVGDAVTGEIERELGATFRHLDLVVGLDAERRGLVLARRAQPPCNAGVVEPALDALAFRDAITRTIVPRLTRLGIDAGTIWSQRWS